jgi:hypothetical protein
MSSRSLNPKSLKTQEQPQASHKPAELLEVSGLCVNCVTAETCTYRSDGKAPVHFCEEFNDTDFALVTKLRHVPTQPTPKDEYVGPSGLKGLCVNCDNRSDCSHALSESGIWHCENYL